MFVCESGQFHFLKYPQGLSSSSDIFNCLTDHAFKQADDSHFRKVVDDLVVFRKDKKEAYERFEAILKVIEDNGIVASLKKLQEGLSVNWCGF